MWATHLILMISKSVDWPPAIMATQLCTTERILPPRIFVTGARKTAFAMPPKANCDDMKKPRSASEKPRPYNKHHEQ